MSDSGEHLSHLLPSDTPQRNVVDNQGAPSNQRDHWKTLCRFLSFPLVFWVLEFFTQRWWIGQDFGVSLVRSFALTGTTLIAAALCSSVVFKWLPRLARFWRIRRYLGVSGFVFITLHVFAVFHFLFNYQFFNAFYSLNPIENPIIFGAIAFIILFLMTATSTDWAVQKLTPKRWKILHRFVYLAEIATIFHFVTINPSLLTEPPTIVLMIVMGLAILGQLYWWIRICAKKKFRTVGAIVGAILILVVISLVILLQ